MRLGTITDSNLARDVTSSDYQATGADTADQRAMMTDLLFADSNIARDGTADSYKAAGADTSDQRIMMSDLLFADSNVARNSTAADYQADVSSCAPAPGNQTDSVWAIDSSGSDTPVPYAKVTIKNSTMTADIETKTADANGVAVFNSLNASTSYVAAVSQSGFTFNTYSFTTGAGATDSIAVYGYDLAPDAPTPGQNLCRVYGYLTDLAGAPVQNAVISMNLDVYGSNAVVYDTATGEIVRATGPTDTTDANGYWQLDRKKSAYLSESGIKYRYTARVNGTLLRNHDKQVTVPDQATARIDSLLAQ